MHFATNEESRNDSRTTCTEHACAWRHTPERHKRKHTYNTYSIYRNLPMDVYKYVVLLLHCALLCFGVFLTNPL